MMSSEHLDSSDTTSHIKWLLMDGFQEIKPARRNDFLDYKCSGPGPGFQVTVNKSDTFRMSMCVHNDILREIRMIYQTSESDWRESHRILIPGAVLKLKKVSDTLKGREKERRRLAYESEKELEKVRAPKVPENEKRARLEYARRWSYQGRLRKQLIRTTRTYLSKYSGFISAITGAAGFFDVTLGATEDEVQVYFDFLKSLRLWLTPINLYTRPGAPLRKTSSGEPNYAEAFRQFYVPGKKMASYQAAAQLLNISSKTLKRRLDKNSYQRYCPKEPLLVVKHSK